MLLKTKRKLLIILMACFIAFALVATATGLTKVFSENNPIISESSISAILDDYNLGDSIEVPQPQNVEISYKNNTYTATSAYLRTPDGKLISARDCKLDSVGVYTLVYSVSVNGKTISAEKSFTVKMPTNASQEGVVVTPLALADVKNVKDATEGGIDVSIPNSAVFKWGEAINLNEFADKPFISFSPDQFSGALGDNANSYGEPQVLNLYVQLTDAYNPDVYVRFNLDNSEKTAYETWKQTQMPAYSIGANGQPARAMSPDIGRDDTQGERLYVEGTEYFVTHEGWPGHPNLGRVDANGSLINLYFDLATARGYVSQRTGVDDGAYVKTLINDVDAKEIYTVNPFVGFTTGEVYLSIFAERYQQGKTTCDMEITSIGNRSGEALAEAYIKDSQAPLLFVDISDKQVANGVFVPFGQKISLPNFSAFDPNMKKEGTTNVSVTYNGKSVAVVNNTFVTNNIGKYIVTYSATDDFGNTATKKIVYNSVDESVEKILNFEIGQFSSAIQAGKETTLPLYELSTLNKYFNVDGYFYYEGEEHEKTSFDADNPTVVFNNVGKYFVVYEYTDFYKTYSSTFEVNVNPSEDFSFTSLILPRHMIKGGKYSLEPVYAKVFNVGKAQNIQINPLVSIDGADYVGINANEFVAEANTSVQFKYTYTVGSNTQFVESDVIPVIDANLGKSLQLESYFTSTPNSTLPAAECKVTETKTINLEATGTPTNKVTTSNSFINAVALSGFEFGFSTVNSNIDGIQIVLTDFYDPTNVMTIQYLANGPKTKLIFEGVEASITKALNGSSFRFYYDKNTDSFSDDNTAYKFVTDKKFTSDYAFMDVSLLNVAGPTTVQLNRVNGQNMKNGSTDQAGPIVNYDDSFCGPKKHNEVITVSKATACDVLCPIYLTDTNLTVSIEYVFVNEDGWEESKYIEDINGIPMENVSALKEYTVKLTEIGEYTITYTAKDQNNKTQFAFNSITVADDSAPVIVVEDGYNESTIVQAEKGEVHEAKGYTVSDNLDTNETLTVSVVVITPWGELYDLMPNNFEYEDYSFDLSLYGEYRVYYYAQDTSGNVTTTYYTVFVK